MSENPSATGNKELASPCWMPTAVVMPMHRDECEEGMPPASRTRRRTLSRWLQATPLGEERRSFE
eukprot:scaffold4370_cov317-Prasinococcus_capsulatus_cf.AAC.4